MGELVHCRIVAGNQHSNPFPVHNAVEDQEGFRVRFSRWLFCEDIPWPASKRSREPPAVAASPTGRRPVHSPKWLLCPRGSPSKKHGPGSQPGGAPARAQGTSPLKHCGRPLWARPRHLVRNVAGGASPPASFITVTAGSAPGQTRSFWCHGQRGKGFAGIVLGPGVDPFPWEVLAWTPWGAQEEVAFGLGKTGPVVTGRATALFPRGGGIRDDLTCSLICDTFSFGRIQGENVLQKVSNRYGESLT